MFSISGSAIETAVEWLAFILGETALGTGGVA